MVLCATCSVSKIDPRCTNTLQTCYSCCTSHASILTCPAHYQQMGNLDKRARLASGLVHPIIVREAALATSSTSASRPSAPSGESDPPGGAMNEKAASSRPADSGLSASSLPVGADQAVFSLPVVRPSLPAGDAVAAPTATAASMIAAMRAELDADRAAAQVREAALQAQLTSIMSCLAALRPAAAPVAPVAQAATAPQLPVQPALPQVSAPPHRGAVLSREAAAVSLVNTYAALANADSDEDTHEVLPHSHTNTLLPAAFVPTPSGSEQSAQQQLAAILSGLSKQGAKIKYANIAELDEALDDWAADALRLGRTAVQVESIRAYQDFLIDDLTGSRHWPLKDVLEYHRKWCKAVHSGTIDMFAPRAWPTTTSWTRWLTPSSTGARRPQPRPHPSRASRGASPRPSPRPRHGARRPLPSTRPARASTIPRRLHTPPPSV